MPYKKHRPKRDLSLVWLVALAALILISFFVFVSKVHAQIPLAGFVEGTETAPVPYSEPAHGGARAADYAEAKPAYVPISYQASSPSTRPGYVPQRAKVCTRFNMNRSERCNSNPNQNSYRDSSDCRSRYDGYTSRRVCPEDSPWYYHDIRAEAVEQDCGYEWKKCIGAFIQPNGRGCILRVIANHQPRGTHEVHLRDLYSIGQVKIRLPGESGHNSWSEAWQYQKDGDDRNMRVPNRWKDPCRYSY